MNLKSFGLKVGPYIYALLILLVLAFAFCAPTLEGKVLNQQDVTMARGQQAEIIKYRKETGKTPLWTNSMFGGMPTYQIHMGEHTTKVNIFKKISNIVRFGLPRYSVDAIFLVMLGFFIFALTLRLNIWIALIGAIAFAFSSYNIIYIETGHINKVYTIALIAPIVGGAILAQRGKLLLGSVLFSVALGTQVAFNHLQITYYSLLILLVWGGYQLYYAYAQKRLQKLVILIGVLVAVAGISIVPNLIDIMPTYEYLSVSSRGGSELASGPTGEKSKGLDKEYAFAWSYSPWETFTLLIPNFKGGGTVGSLDESSNLYNALRKNGVPAAQAKQYINQVYLYWGAKRSTEGPFYYGSIIIFLFILGLFIVPSKSKWWIVTISLLAIVWSWGENFYWFSSLFFDYFPLFNKFRVPETFLVITSFTFPLMAILALSRITNDELSKTDVQKYIKYSALITGGILLFFILFAKGIFSFDSQLDAYYGQMPAWFFSALKDDRAHMLKADAFRSLIFVLLAVGAFWLFTIKKLKVNHLYIALAVFILIDLWGVDRRYLSNDNFDKPKKVQELQPSQADLQILQDKDPHYRVFNLNNPFNESHTSYFHKSLGGYFAAKIARYDDIIQYQLSKQNMSVINMLNAKYLIVPTKEGGVVAHLNTEALGNAWFIQKIQWVDGAEAEMNALNDFNPATTAIVDKHYTEYFSDKNLSDSTIGSIRLTSYAPDTLRYESNSSTGGLSVFSETYYNQEKGWNAYIDGEIQPHIRVNYILRALYIPAGSHSIEFRFEPKIVKKAQRIALIGSIAVAVMLLASLIAIILKLRSETAVKE